LSDVSRRDLLKTAAPIVAFVALEALGPSAASAKPRETKLSEGVIFPDPTLCIGCLTCEVICSRVHKEQGLSDTPRIRIFNDPQVKVDPVIQSNPEYRDRGSFHQEPCLQCPTAECLFVCPVDALQVEPRTGARVIHEDICVSCGRCAEACPFPVSPEAEATNQLTFGQHTRITYDPEADTFTKCDLCYWREGGPACVERCPVNIRIKQGIIKSDRLCLSEPTSDRATWGRLRAFQTFGDSPAKGKA
jgi:Fe-S-cluster-containing hydrogenase component 2